MLYASDYGFSDRLSQTIARGITKANVAVEMLDLLSADPQVHHPHLQKSVAPGSTPHPRHASCLSMSTATEQATLGIWSSASIQVRWVRAQASSYGRADNSG